MLTLRLVVGFKFARTGAPASPRKTDLAATALDSVLAIYKANSYLLWDFFHLPQMKRAAERREVDMRLGWADLWHETWLLGNTPCVETGTN